MKITLFTYWRSSCSYRVRIALNVKGLAYESVFVNLLEGAQTRAEHLARNPMGYVPSLLIDGQLVSESVAIVELLDELAPLPSLYPRDPWARARVRTLVETVNAGTQPLQNLNVLKKLGDDKDRHKEWSRHFITRGLAAFEKHMEANETSAHEQGGALAKGPFAYGDAFSAADVFLVPQIYNARRFGVDLTPFPRITRANEAALACEAVQIAIPENQPDAI